MSFSRALVLLLSDLFLVALGTFFAFVLRDGIDIDAERNQFRLLYLAVSLGVALIVLLSAGCIVLSIDLRTSRITFGCRASPFSS